MKKQLFDNRANFQIAVLGDLILDEYIFGTCDRISPEAPVPVVKVTNKENRLGGAANVVFNIHTFGGKVIPFAVLGNDFDKASTEIVDKFELYRIPTHGLTQCSNHIVPRKVRVNAGGQNIVRYDIELDTRTIEKSALDSLIGRIGRYLEPCGALLISDYNFGVVTEEVAQAAINCACEHDIPSIVDPKGTDWEKYRNCTLITPNMKELETWLGRPIKNFEEEQAACKKVLQELGCAAVVLTKSEKGMTIHYGNGDFETIKTKAKQVADVTGAGDTVTAFLGLALCAGFSVGESCRIANDAAGIAVGKVGTAPVTAEELQDSNSILSRTAVSILAGRLRIENKKIVFTNGCFDILHAGHLHSLKEAKSQGDVLIVGINSDKSVTKLKGPERPLINELERAQMLTHLECVDYVVIFDEDEPTDLIRSIKPDVLVKGADYRDKKIAGSEFAGRIHLVEFENAISTTKIVEKIKSSIS